MDILKNFPPLINPAPESPLFVYTDGGQKDGNPSYVGGASGFRIVAHKNPPKDDPDDLIIQEFGAVVLPESIGSPYVSNNHVELAGIIAAGFALLELQPLPPKVRFCPDSIYALRSLEGTQLMGNAPVILMRLLLPLRAALKASGIQIEYELLKGHGDEIPGALEAGGVMRPTGYRRVSIHNVAIDKLCTTLAATIEAPTAEEINARQGTGLFTVGEVLAVTRQRRR